MVLAQQPGNALRPHAAQWERLLAAEDARARTPAQLAVILETTRATEPELRRLAVRALGRLERAELADTIALHLADASARVRTEAAHAIGQALFRDPGVRLRDRLAQALSTEKDAGAAGAIAETIGRLRHSNAEEARASIALLLPRLQGEPLAVLGAVRGLFFLARQPNARPAFDASARSALLKVANSFGGTVEATERARTVATSILVAINGLDGAAVSSLMFDRNPLVRREVLGAVPQLQDTAVVGQIITRALNDEIALVRYEGLRHYARRLAPSRGCKEIIESVTDPAPHVALMAIDFIATSCRGNDEIAMLDGMTRSLVARSDGAWAAAARALVALSIRAPDRARSRLNSFTRHRNPFVRMYGAVAADTLRDAATLIRLAQDEHPNVRTAAVEGLRRAAGHTADSVYIAQLTQDDSQLLQAAAAALDGSVQPGAPAALLAALDRISTSRRETSRDARNALLVRIRQLGNASLAERLRPYLRDFDPQIATRAAETLQAWTGTAVQAEPVAPPTTPLPTFAEIEALTRSRVIIQLFEAQVEMQLRPFDAPTNAARFVRLARAGYFDGLTFHRIAPNFVVQGGSPNANEYAGDGPFSRDELGVENWRGTVGISTRGRDTGDAQIYINLIDNVRLDHDYTVFARVMSGMEWFDHMIEGTVMRRVQVRD